MDSKNKGKSFDSEKSIINQSAPFEFTAKKKEIPEKLEPVKTGTPMIIKCIAFSPALFLAAGFIGALSCGLLGLRESCIFGNHQEEFMIIGGLGWFVSMPIAGLLKLLHWISKLES